MTTKADHACVFSAFVVAAMTCIPTSTDASDAKPIVVHTSVELLAAIDQKSAHQSIRLTPGDYPIDRALVLGDDVALVGSGVMLFDADGLPRGFEPGTQTIIRAAAGFNGDLLTMGNRTSIRGVFLRDLEDDPAHDVHRAGNVVVVASRAPGDAITASIVECEIFNPNPFSFDSEGPTGHALAVFTRNPALQEPPPPHEGAAVSVTLERSSVHATGNGGVVFIGNFAARGRLHVALNHNRLEGPLTATAAANRPDPVTRAEAQLESDHNLFIASAASHTQGWFIFGASSSPHHLAGDLAGPSFNAFHLNSSDDRIEGFAVGISAAVARRVLAGSGPVSNNLLDLDLRRLRIRTEGDAAADLKFYAAVSEQDQTGSQEFLPGNGNILRVRIQGATGSGIRANEYVPVAGPQLPSNRGVGNRIEFIGDPAEFARSNRGFEPLPPAAYFGDER
jgi:hypothetical protein